MAKISNANTKAIESFKAKVEEQRAYIDLLTSCTNNASAQVKDIALKALENSGMRLEQTSIPVPYPNQLF